MKHYSLLLLLMLMNCATPVAVYADLSNSEARLDKKVIPVEGVHYKKINDHRDKVGPMSTVPVLKFFKYSCKYCYKFEPDLQKWKLQKPAFIKLDYMHVVWDKSDKMLSQVFYTARELGVSEKLRQPLFDYHHSWGWFFEPEDARKFFVKNGVKGDLFDMHFNSMKVINSVIYSQQLMNNFKINATPSFVVANQYYMTPNMSKSNDEMFRVIEFVSEKIKLGEM